MVSNGTLHLGHFGMEYRVNLPSQEPAHLSSIEESAAAPFAVLDDKISVLRVLAFLELVPAPRADELRRRELNNLQLDRISSSTTGECFPLVPVQPDATTTVALVYLDTELMKNIHGLSAFRTF